MLWFFERNDESLKLELRYDNATSEFVAIVRYPDGRERTERFTDRDAYGAWLEAFERNLEHQQWARHPAGPVVVPYGWPNKRLS
jgi:hypothetical protein